MSLVLAPATLTDALAFVRLHHRHHRAPQGGLFAVGVALEAEPLEHVGVAIVGRPVARRLDADAYCVEVTRVAVLEGVRNACSMLYGACWRAARALGYRRLITYTLASESGVSLRASGYREVARTGGKSWSVPTRERIDKHPLGEKVRWEAGS